MIYIPTYRRATALDQLTWSMFPPRWKTRTTVVVHKDEALWFKAQGMNYLVCPVQGTGITPVRQWILDHTQGPIIMMDDDFKFAKRRSDEPTKFASLNNDPEEVGVMLDILESMFEQSAVVGLHNRGGANFAEYPVVTNGRINGVIGVDSEIARQEGIKFSGVELMEDFHLALQFLLRGYPNAVLSSYVKDFAGLNAPGGCSTFRTSTRQADAARRLQHLYPNFVSLSERPPMRGEDVPRTDVRVGWAKAAKAGREGRELMGREQELTPDWTGLL